MGNEVTKLSPEELKNRQIQKVDMEMSRKMQKGSRYNSMYWFDCICVEKF